MLDSRLNLRYHRSFGEIKHKILHLPAYRMHLFFKILALQLRVCTIQGYCPKIICPHFFFKGPQNLGCVQYAGKWGNLNETSEQELHYTMDSKGVQEG